MNEINSNHPDLLHADETDAPEDADQKPERKRGSRAALYIAYLALFFTAVGITVGYKHWLRIHDKAKTALKEIHVVKQQLEDKADSSHLEQLKGQLDQTSAEAEQRLSDSLQELDQIREQTTYSARSVSNQIAELTLQQQAGGGSTEATAKSQLTEVRFLLGSAQRRLQLEYNKDNALLLLEAADEVLIQMGTPELLSVRENLARDIAELNRFTLTDVEELSAKIARLEADITPLATLDKELPDGEKVTLFDVQEKDSLSGKVKDYLNRSVEIRKQSELPRNVLNSNDKKLTDQLISLRLESLRLTMMQRHNIEFHRLIASLKTMLSNYYPANVAKPWIETLEELDSIDLAPKLPNISSALDLLLETTATEKPES